MTGFEAFRMWVSVRLHFTKKEWDIKVRRFGVVCNYETYLARRDYKSFESIATKYTQKQFFKYLVANSIYGYNEMIFDIGIGNHNVRVFEGNKGRRTDLLWKDLNFIDICGVSSDAYKIVSLMARQQISIESVVLINMVKHLTQQIRDCGKATVIESLLTRIDKAATFFNVSEEQRNKINSIIVF